MDTRLKEYAQLLVQVGLNVQRGQQVNIFASVDCAVLARACAEVCYDVGAREVTVLWNDDRISRLKYLRADDAVFDEMPPWLKTFYDSALEKKCPHLAIVGDDPQALQGVDPARIQRWRKVSGKALEEYYKGQTNNDFQWLVAACPTPAWAGMVFPGAEDAVERLWDAVYAACRVTGDGKAVERWAEHVAAQKKLVAKLNEYAFTTLHYRSGLGTDLTVGLPENHFWTGASEMAGTGVEFIANLPTEEIFSLPHRDRVNGRVVASKPLSLNGNLVNGFWFELKDGKIVDLHADVGEEILRKSVALDEGSSYLGEVALVPYDSPISNTNILFYETLFDENAACHFAFGEAYPCIQGADKLSPQEQAALGINQSINHVDFMVGTADLEIIGTTPDGREIQVFEEGNFAL
jgi:aminopeptidase